MPWTFRSLYKKTDRWLPLKEEPSG
jgi:hypothetical protein